MDFYTIIFILYILDLYSDLLGIYCNYYLNKKKKIGIYYFLHPKKVLGFNNS